MGTSRLQIVSTDLETVVPLRMEFSDPPRGREACLSPGDSTPQSQHFAAYLQGRLVGVCSVGPEPLPVLHHPPAWRSRGLVVVPDVRNLGVGPALLQHELRYVESQPNPLAWGYAKRRLAELYSLLGFRPTGYVHMHPVSGETLLFGNEHVLRLIRDAAGVAYVDGEVPSLGAVDA